MGTDSDWYGLKASTSLIPASFYIWQMPYSPWWQDENTDFSRLKRLRNSFHHYAHFRGLLQVPLKRITLKDLSFPVKGCMLIVRRISRTVAERSQMYFPVVNVSLIFSMAYRQIPIGSSRAHLQLTARKRSTRLRERT
jgi:hypothetical protein